MFNKEELLLMREALDNHWANKQKDEQHKIWDLRDKCTDLLILQKLWRKKQNLCDFDCGDKQ